MSSHHDQSSKKRKKMESSPSTSSKPAHFFKIILDHTILDKRLEIPKEFLKKFGNELSDRTIIKVPGGSTWHIRLSERRGVISFEHGWQKFMDFYSISVGYFLVFRYKGKSKFKSKFHVLIFNTTATEIEYPVIHNFLKARVIDIDSSSTHSNSEASTQSESSSSCRGGHVNRETDEPVDELPKRRKVLAATVTTKRSRSNTSRITKSKETATRAAEAFRSKKPFFKAIMNASCVKTGGNMHVPSDFAIPYLQHKTSRVTLRVPGSKSWDVGVIFTEHLNKITLSKGWRKFALDNHLSIGDVCVFELVDRKKFEMNVHIFRVLKTNCKDKSQGNDTDSASTDSTQSESSASRDGQRNLEFEPTDEHDLPKRRKVFSNTVPTRKWCSNPSQVSLSKERGARAAAEAFRSEKPFFIATIHESCVKNGTVNVPANFTRLHLPQRTTLVNLRVLDTRKSWDVKIIFSEKHRRRNLSKGWMKFFSGNQLKIGDVCVFELIDSKKILMNVHIFRASQEAYSSANLKMNAPPATRSKEKSLASAKSLKATKPSFQATMCRSYLEHGFVHVPAAFTTQYLKHAVMEVTVRVSDGRTWKIKCTTAGDKYKRAKLSQGWAKFVSDNHLSKGDICVFKLVNEETCEMKASVVRVSQNRE